jgi:hypothetical protein
MAFAEQRIGGDSLREAIHHDNLFKSTPVIFQQELHGKFQPMTIDSEQYIYHKGQSSDCMFFLSNGKIEVVVVFFFPFHLDLSPFACLPPTIDHQREWKNSSERVRVIERGKLGGRLFWSFGISAWADERTFREDSIPMHPQLPQSRTVAVSLKRVSTTEAGDPGESSQQENCRRGRFYAPQNPSQH